MLILIETTNEILQLNIEGSAEACKLVDWMRMMHSKPHVRREKLEGFNFRS